MSLGFPGWGWVFGPAPVPVEKRSRLRPSRPRGGAGVAWMCRWKPAPSLAPRGWCRVGVLIVCGTCRCPRRLVRRVGDWGIRPAGRFPPGHATAVRAAGVLGGAGTPRRCLGHRAVSRRPRLRPVPPSCQANNEPWTSTRSPLTAPLQIRPFVSIPQRPRNSSDRRPSMPSVSSPSRTSRPAHPSPPAQRPRGHRPGAHRQGHRVLIPGTGAACPPAGVQEIHTRRSRKLNNPFQRSFPYSPARFFCAQTLRFH